MFTLRLNSSNKFLFSLAQFPSTVENINDGEGILDQLKWQSPGNEFHVRLCKIKSVGTGTSVLPLEVLPIFYFVVPETFKNINLNCFYENGLLLQQIFLKLLLLQSAAWTSVADPAFQFDTDPDSAFQFDTDPDSYRFKEVMYLKQYFLYILTWFSLSVGSKDPTKRHRVLC